MRRLATAALVGVLAAVFVASTLGLACLGLEFFYELATAAGGVWT